MIAVIDWTAAALLKENKNFIQRARSAGKVQPREVRGASGRRRSLTLCEDGSCELQDFSTAAAARRLGGAIVRKARNGRRG